MKEKGICNFFGKFKLRLLQNKISKRKRWYDGYVGTAEAINIIRERLEDIKDGDARLAWLFNRLNMNIVTPYQSCYDSIAELSDMLAIAEQGKRIVVKHITRSHAPVETDMQEFFMHHGKVALLYYVRLAPLCLNKYVEYLSNNSVNPDNAVFRTNVSLLEKRINHLTMVCWILTSVVADTGINQLAGLGGACEN